MPLPKPESGLVVGYSYLWKREALTGLQEGRKDRPCAIILAKTVETDGRTQVTVAPISHSAPLSTELALELPRAVCAHLGLDWACSWIHYEVNRFWWPGPDLRPANQAGTFAYGFLPPRLFRRIAEDIAALATDHKLGLTRRDEDMTPTRSSVDFDM